MPVKVILLLTLFAATTLAAKAPNFVLIYIDDLGWAQTSVEMIEGDPETRSDYFQTPSLERLAAGGRVLSACYSPAPLCAPSRNSLLHGMTPSRLRLTTLSTVEVKKEYRGQITIPKALKQAIHTEAQAQVDKPYEDCFGGAWELRRAVS